MISVGVGTKNRSAGEGLQQFNSQNRQYSFLSRLRSVRLEGPANCQLDTAFSPSYATSGTLSGWYFTLLMQPSLIHVRFGVFTAVTMGNDVFWNVSSSPILVALMMEALSSSEMSVIT
jgi:hypothetical protein